MSLTTEQYEKIMRFMDAKMDAAEMDAFVKELTSNPEMRRQLDFEQSLRDGFALRKVTSLPGTGSAQGGVVTPKALGKITDLRRWLAIGAAVITAFMLFAIFWKKPNKPTDMVNVNNRDTTQKTAPHPQVIVAAPAEDSSATIDLTNLFNQYFKKDVVPEHYPLFLAEALMDYESGNYKTLQQLNLNNLRETRGAGATDSRENILLLGHYYKGLAFLQTNNTRDAIINLHWVLNNRPGKALQAKTKWYLALAYVKENNSAKAAELCRSIVGNKDNDILVKSAEKILAAMGK